MSKPIFSAKYAQILKCFTIFLLPIIYVFTLNLTRFIPPLYLFIVFLITILIKTKAESKRFFILYFFCILLSLICIRVFIQEISYINGNPVTSSLQNHDRAIVEKFLYQPKKGDIVMISSHGSNSIGRVLEEPHENLTSKKISKENYLVEVGNSQYPYQEEVERNKIIGKFKSRFWPINRIGLIASEKAEADKKVTEISQENDRKRKEKQAEEEARQKIEEIISGATISSSGKYQCTINYSGIDLDNDAQKAVRECLEVFLTRKGDSWFTLAFNNLDWHLEEWKGKSRIHLESSTLSKVEILNEVKWRGKGRLEIEAIRTKQDKGWNPWTEPKTSLKWIDASIMSGKDGLLSDGLLINLECVKDVWKVELNISGYYKKPTWENLS
jgi:signal peptidase I